MLISKNTFKFGAGGENQCEEQCMEFRTQFKLKNEAQVFYLNLGSHLKSINHLHSPPSFLMLLNWLQHSSIF